SIVYSAEHDSNVRTLNIPIGTNSLHDLIEIPPGSASTTSALGQQRLYNKADFIILVTSNAIVGKSGLYNNFATSVTWLDSQNVVRTNNSFYNLRENTTINIVDFDISKLNTQYATLVAALGRNPK